MPRYAKNFEEPLHPLFVESLQELVKIRLRAEMPKFLQEKGFQIERGEAGSMAVHKSVKKYKADMEKEKAALEVSIQKEKLELSQIASTKVEIKSVEQIPTGKTMFGRKIPVRAWFIGLFQKSIHTF